CSLFAFSHGEARLARRLAAGDMLATAAHVCGISYETARKRLKGAFDKTDTRRQSELVALLIRLGSIFGVTGGATAMTNHESRRAAGMSQQEMMRSIQGLAFFSLSPSQPPRRPARKHPRPPSACPPKSPPVSLR